MDMEVKEVDKKCLNDLTDNRKDGHKIIQITVDFKNIILELKNKKIRLCYIKNKSWYVQDAKGNLYQVENYWHGSYLDKWIRNGTVVKFNLVDAQYIEEWEKEIWGVKKIEEFIKQQSQYWIKKGEI